MKKCSIDSYRKIIKENIGSPVSLSVKKGRKHITVNNCIIENAYDRIFTVRILGESLIKCSVLSVCYADLITGNARVVLQKMSKEA